MLLERQSDFRRAQVTSSKDWRLLLYDYRKCNWSWSQKSTLMQRYILHAVHGIAAETREAAVGRRGVAPTQPCLQNTPKKRQDEYGRGPRPYSSSVHLIILIVKWCHVTWHHLTIRIISVICVIHLKRELCYLKDTGFRSQDYWRVLRRTICDILQTLIFNQFVFFQ